MSRAPLGLIDFAYVVVVDEPLIWEEAIKAQDVTKWKKVVDEKYYALMKNETQDLIELLEGRKAIGTKWVFCIKRKANGDIDKYWAKVVAEGFFQTKGLDFNETFALVAKLPSIKMLLALITILDLEVHYMDVKNAF